MARNSSKSKLKMRSGLSWMKFSNKVKVLAFVLVFAVAGSTYVLVTHAAASPNDFCNNSGAGECVTPAGNKDAFGVPVVTNYYTPLRWQDVYQTWVGHAWSFSDTYWDNKYINNSIYHIRLYEDPLVCLGVNGSDQVVTASCSLGGNSVDWVKSGTWYINIAATNRTSGGTGRKILSASYDKQGTNVWASSPGTWSAYSQNWDWRYPW